MNTTAAPSGTPEPAASYFLVRHQTAEPVHVFDAYHMRRRAWERRADVDEDGAWLFDEPFSEKHITVMRQLGYNQVSLRCADGSIADFYLHEFWSQRTGLSAR